MYLFLYCVGVQAGGTQTILLAQDLGIKPAVFGGPCGAEDGTQAPVSYVARSESQAQVLLG